MKESPQILFLSNLVGATSIVRDIRIPAYTNDMRMVMIPEKDVWKTIYLAQLDDYPNDDTIAIKGVLQPLIRKSFTSNHWS